LIDQTLYAVIMEAWFKGISTRMVDGLAAAIGSRPGILRSEVSRICQGLDAMDQAFLDRPMQGCLLPYLSMDATYRLRQPGKTQQVGSRVVVVMAIQSARPIELLGLQVGDSESEPVWREFLGSIRQRGHSGPSLGALGCPRRPDQAVGCMFQGLSWQRCRVHFAWNLLQTVPKVQKEMAAVVWCSVFTNQSPAAVEEQLDQVAAMLTG
jgi:transposase-like protein